MLSELTDLISNKVTSIETAKRTVETLKADAQGHWAEHVCDASQDLPQDLQTVLRSLVIDCDKANQALHATM